LITTFLLTLPEPADGFRIGAHQKSQTEKSNPKEAIARQAEPAEPQISAEDIRRGREEFISHGCISCHSVNGLGGRFAPPLDGESGRRERPFVEERITNAQFFTKEFPDEYGERGLVMPPTDVSSKDIKQITDFIMSLPEIKSEHSDIQ
jgi:mono/diheme cytochrome c family protein